MRMVLAYIREERLPFVRKALEGAGIYGMNVRGVTGRGEQGGVHLQFRGGILNVDLLPKVRMEIIVPDSIADVAIDAIKKSAYTGKSGDGRIFTIPVVESIRIRTGEVEV